jgi:hypothetical protein
VVIWLACLDQQDVVQSLVSDQLDLHWLLLHSVEHGDLADHYFGELLDEDELDEAQEEQQTSGLFTINIIYILVSP